MTVLRIGKSDDTLYKLKLARMAVTSSSARKQPKGTIAVAQSFLAQINLGLLSENEAAGRFARILDLWTKVLRARLESNSWGHARKFLSIFLYLCTRDFKIRDRYKLAGLDNLLEIPLDSHVARALQAFEKCTIHSGGENLTWTSIGQLTSTENDRFQYSAQVLATKFYLSRADLDLKLWRRPFQLQAKCILCHEN